MKKMSKIGLFLVAILLTVWPAAILAHGGGTPQLFREPAGPYLVSVWSLPEELVVGQVNLVVLVAEAASEAADDYVLDADVTLQFTNGRSSFDAAATHDQATNNLFYEAYVDLDRGGSWEVTVDVDGTAGPGGASFEMQVAGDGTFNTTWLLYGGIALALAVIGWLVWQFLTEKKGER